MSRVAVYPSPAEDLTHHVLGGAPAYSERFLHVGKFHAPGLAPVSDPSGAFHIDLHGKPAYDRRFSRTFGFYEELASVRDEKSWFHINPDGTPAYDEKFAWCGNFQEGLCPVRDHSGLFYHLQKDGSSLYPERHLYAGDYRDGVACVRLADGLCAHINRNGIFLHAGRFLDLDVFHKGFARARDARGWMHIDSCGRPAYSARFAEVEPFYNGFAYVLGFDGQRYILSESGETILRIQVGAAAPKHASRTLPFLVIVGAPGTGKTALGRWIHEELGLRLASIDVERMNLGDGSTAGEMRAWASFLGQIEQRACDGVEFSGSGPFVHHVKQALHNAGFDYRVVWLKATWDTCFERLKGRDALPPYPFVGRPFWETARELHTRLELEMAEERYWKKDRILVLESEGTVETLGSRLVQSLPGVHS